MNNKDSRKYLRAKIYRIIFREIYPCMQNNFSIGDADHAIEINRFIKQRQVKHYNYDEYDYLELHSDDISNLLDYNFTIDEKGFYNWISGTSSPKHIIVINAILEYLINTCNDEGKLQLLKNRILEILHSDEFNSYVGNMIKEIVDIWTEQIENGDTRALFKATKEILYLLKDKNKFLPYLLSKTQDNTSAVTVDLESNKGLIHKNSPLKKGKFKAKYLNTKHITAGIAVLLFILLCGYVEYKIVRHKYESTAPVSNIKATTAVDLVAPEITSPLNNSVIPIDGIKIKWNPVKSVDGYFVAVFETNNWTKIFSKSRIKDTSITLDKSLFKTGGFYRVYVHSSLAADDSLPNYTDIGIQKLLPPKITSPKKDDMLNTGDVKVEWDAVPSVESYLVTVTDTNNWSKVFSKSDIKNNSTTLSKSLFKNGGFYCIYVHSKIGNEFSEPNSVNISIKK